MRKLLSLTMAVAFAAALAGCGSSSSTTQPQQQPQQTQQQQQAQTQPPAATAAYEISRVEDVSNGEVKRFDYYVLVKDAATEDQLKVITQNVVEKAKQDTPFNDLTIYYYDRAEYMDRKPATLGYVIYTFDGDKDKANQIKTGEYGKMSYDWQLRNVDWNKRPTDAEMRVYNEWQKAKNAVQETGREFSESEFAQRVNMTVDQVKDAVDKNIEWLKDRT